MRLVKKSKVSVPVSPWCSVLSAERPKSSKTDLASLVCWAVLLALPLVVRFGRSAAQIFQNGPPLLFQPHRSLSLSLPGAPFCPLSGPNPPKRTSPGLLGCGPFWPLSSPNPPKRTSPAWSVWLCSLLSLWWSVWPLSSPNPSKRTSPAWSAWLCSLLSLWWSVLAAQQPKSFKTDLPNSSTSCGCRAGSNPRSSG